MCKPPDQLLATQRREGISFAFLVQHLCILRYVWQATDDVFADYCSIFLGMRKAHSFDINIHSAGKKHPQQEIAPMHNISTELI